MRILLLLLVMAVMLPTPPSHAQIIATTDWTITGLTSATGSLGGTTIFATVAGASWIDTPTGLFDNPPYIPQLATLDEGLRGVSFTPSDKVSFTFSPPVTGLLFYFSSWDLDSEAIIISNTTSVLGSNDGFVQYDGMTLTSLETSANKNGKGILQFNGSVSFIDFTWTKGIDSANGVIHTFALVPEGSTLCLAVIGLLGASPCRRRKR